MKKLMWALIASGVVLWSCNNQPSTNGENNDSNDNEVKREALTGFDIAYVNVDSVLLQYKFSIELNDELTEKQARSQSDLESQYQEYQKDVAKYQKMVQMGAFLTEDQQKEIMGKENQLRQLEADMSNKLMAEQQRMNTQLYDSITGYIQKFNADKRYKLILSHSFGGVVLDAHPSLNITDSIISGLNSRYKTTEEIQ